MNIKRLILCIIIITTSLGLIACSSLKSKIVKGGESALNVKSDKEIANTRFQKIIECLEKNDKKGLKKMFSPKALKEAKDIDGGIDYIRGFYKGKIKSKDVALAVSDHKDNGEKTSELQAYYTVTTDKDTYTVFFIDQTVDIKNPDNVGLNMLQIIKASDDDKEFDWGGDKTKCAGIYRPATVKKQAKESV
ncbi:DUF5104 domain-containing protein [Clostridium estertheticum]|uniref:DUF5104 domain-containing protein n=1 Tax=Clostridium estertheticum TaxID=238834 RepID=UPI001C0ACA86|nr:DUF5104 domain-containing protein [Clostridium estertheticum]MBU3075522.1 DUF5104 domain-containing protein [Clostridium estertheticum]MBU3165648.1 DUF5104 domain-containing protein [Clostridium estertheticum]